MNDKQQATLQDLYRHLGHITETEVEDLGYGYVMVTIQHQHNEHTLEHLRHCTIFTIGPRGGICRENRVY